MHISPRTVRHLCDVGHDAIRVDEVLPNNASDRSIVTWAAGQERVVLTQDLDFSDIIALSSATRPSIITLRLSDSTVDNVNQVLDSVLPRLEDCVRLGLAASVEDERVRIRRLPIN